MTVVGTALSVYGGDGGGLSWTFVLNRGTPGSKMSCGSALSGFDEGEGRDGSAARSSTLCLA